MKKVTILTDRLPQLDWRKGATVDTMDDDVVEQMLELGFVELAKGEKKAEMAAEPEKAAEPEAAPSRRRRVVEGDNK